MRSSQRDFGIICARVPIGETRRRQSQSRGRSPLAPLLRGVGGGEGLCKSIGRAVMGQIRDFRLRLRSPSSSPFPGKRGEGVAGVALNTGPDTTQDER
jgi:hypothetical protein